MAEGKAARRSGSETQGFVIIDKTAQVGDYDGQSGEDSGETVGGFVVTESPRKRTETSSADSIGVDQPLPRARRCSVCGEEGHTARTCTAQSNEVGTRASKKPSKDAVGMLAPMVVGTINFSVVSTFGEACSLTQFEQNLLIPSMQRVMERMPAAAAQRASVIIDPLVILTVMIMWGKRIASIKREEARKEFQVEPFEAARAAGASGTTYSVPDAQQENVPEPVSVNGHYGAPNMVREGFSESI